MDEYLKTCREANRVNRARAKEAEEALYGIMLVLDRDDFFQSQLSDTPEWKRASHVLGWDIDWEKIYNA